MQILIMRHGDAAYKTDRDAEKTLTTKGYDESSLIAYWLSKQVKVIDKVLVSPYLRAQQTLNVLQRQLLLSSRRQVLPELKPDGDAKVVCQYLQVLANRGLNQVLVISHMPLVGHLVANLCRNEPFLMFTTSAIANVDIASVSGIGKLCWKVEPIKLVD